MGCNYSEQTKEEFNSKVYKQAAAIQELLIKKEELLQIINKLQKQEFLVPNIKTQKREFYPKISIIEEQINNLQSKINDSRQHTSSPEINIKKIDIEIPKEEAERDKDPKVSKSRKHRIRSNSSHILEDPSIKSIIESKKKILERKKTEEG
ncbi:unnamed protein product [Blepharisma stoltei]|uniref:Uncharacterized protein n=1 Tax=Blepharisma stoltei TaxID=1481888 RepID=A0AAU9ILG9_9CILI|nr:unnamed protein product [Blepharisma stoltei]